MARTISNLLILFAVVALLLCPTDSIPVTSQRDVRCNTCAFLVKELEKALDSNAAIDCISDILIKYCIKLDIEDPTICRAAINNYASAIMYIATEMFVNDYTICTELLGVCDFPPEDYGVNWTLPLPGNKPKVSGYPIPTSNAKTMRVLQLADIHFDDKYIVGAEALCGEPLCCRDGAPNKGNNGTVSTPAGYWGSTIGKCDIPIQTVESALSFAANNLNVDLILWTGDLLGHNVWGYTKQHHLEGFQKINAMFKRYFPTTPIVSALGNHEGVPCNMVPANNVPSEYSHDWLYNSLTPDWIDWLGPMASSDVKTDMTSNIQTRATYLVKAMPGLRIISLNTIYAYNLNAWMYMNETDPDGTMTWFIEQLTDAEQAGDKVWVIGHISNDQTLPSWSKLYYETVNRFEDTIRGQFFGHTHYDQFNIFYENCNSTQRATSVEYICPSVTTFPHMNPVLRVYTIDTSNQYTVLDHENWEMDIDAANAAGANVTPVWKLEYRAKDAYRLANLNPSEWNGLTARMLDNPSFVQQYLTYKKRKSAEVCDELCTNLLVCNLRRARAILIPGTINSLCGDLQFIPRQKPLTAIDIDELTALARSLPKCPIA